MRPPFVEQISCLQHALPTHSAAFRSKRISKNRLSVPPPRAPMKRIPRKSISEIDLRNLTIVRLAPDEVQHFAAGVALFNDGRYWHAHEVWEEIWKEHPEDGRIFFQGLIQLAAGYHQLNRNIFRGFSIHIRQAREKFALFPREFLGIDLASLLGVIEVNLKMIDEKNSVEEIDRSKIVVPKIQYRPQ